MSRLNAAIYPPNSNNPVRQRASQIATFPLENMVHDFTGGGSHICDRRIAQRVNYQDLTVRVKSRQRKAGLVCRD